MTQPPALPPGRVPLDGPPPAPMPMATGDPRGGGGGYGGLANPGEDPQKEAMKGLAAAFQTVDQVLLAAAQSLPQGSKEFGMARKLIEQGLSKGLAAIGQSPETSSTAAGDQFPGGGFGSVGAVGT